jgi:hypothetical protein
MPEQEKEKPKTIVEEVQEKFNIQINENDFQLQKPLDPKWMPEIIERTIKSVDIPFEFIQKNKSTCEMTLNFETVDARQQFENKFNMNLFKIMNHFLREKNLDPKKYKRGILCETSVSENILQYSFYGFLRSFFWWFF